MEKFFLLLLSFDKREKQQQITSFHFISFLESFGKPKMKCNIQMVMISTKKKPMKMLRNEFFSKEKMKEFNSKDDDDGFWIKRTETDAKKKNTKPSSIIEPREKN